MRPSWEKPGPSSLENQSLASAASVYYTLRVDRGKEKGRCLLVRSWLIDGGGTRKRKSNEKEYFPRRPFPLYRPPLAYPSSTKAVYGFTRINLLVNSVNRSKSAARL